MAITAARRIGVVSVIALAISAAWASPAAAYLDPGTGSMVLQGIIGAIAGGLVALRIYWSKIKFFFSSNSESKAAKGGNANKD